MSAAAPVAVAADLVKQLREKTNAGLMDCKRALEEAKGDLAAAEIILRKKGVASASKKAGREAKEGVVGSYIHAGDKVGVLVEINCETDFVARNEKFRELVKAITLQIAAASPLYLRQEEVPASVIATEKEVAASQIKGKPPEVVEKILVGRLEKYYSTSCLLEQAYIKDPNITINDLIKSKISELGENIVLKRFVRFQVGESVS